MKLAKDLLFPPHSALPCFQAAAASVRAVAAKAAAEAQARCPVCLTSRKDMAFACGHQTCRGCGNRLEICPICRQEITLRIRLYS